MSKRRDHGKGQQFCAPCHCLQPPRITTDKPTEECPKQYRKWKKNIKNKNRGYTEIGENTRRHYQNYLPVLNRIFAGFNAWTRNSGN